MNLHRDRGPTRQAIEHTSRDLTQRVVVLILDVLAVTLLDEDVGLAARPEVDLDANEMGRSSLLGENTPDEAIGLELVPDPGEARSVGVLGAAERGGQHAERLR